ncbi:polyprenol monophosphomannose synthase [Amnibacterium sp.]|uniref:polyprenol monophosphomannose synthase n=1 Tax=Amnibacterium sp. TaxID=1872496 RepID=UPI00262A1DDD|nr:polyprenol monophosphomannose synthase [Amnibacterium sp.]MCU1473267.1 dolichol-phosphate mannosyltransferase [Amnibacterium sp.]
MSSDAEISTSTLVCVPTYNEAESLPVLLPRIAAVAPEVEVLVIDDNSPDGTGAIADGFAARDPRVHVLHRTGKGGLGAAYLAGFRWGLDHGFDVVVEMDADGSHRPEDLPRLLAALQEADVVLGTRWMEGGETVNWPWPRRLLSRAGNLYARVMLRVAWRDITGGFRAYRSTALQALDLATVRSEGYCFQVELALRAGDAELLVREVPITFVEREQGSSKMSRSIVVEAMRRVTVWGVIRAFRGLSGRRRRKAAAAVGPRPGALGS